jgi:beta-lactamase regulating signal transducer with metallopeptidase domain
MGHLALHIQSVDEILLKLKNVANKLHTFNPGMRVFVARRIPTKDEVALARLS